MGLTPTERTVIRRGPEKAAFDVATLYDVLDSSLIAHVGICDSSGQPFVLPTAFARVENSVAFHGSTASRLFKSLAHGSPCCLTVTCLDGLVLARSAFESSMNYRSAVVLGVPQVVTGDRELAVLESISEHLMPGRWSEIRPPAEQELKATLTLVLELAECSVKIRRGGPEDVPDDLATTPWSTTWAGHVPMSTTFGTPVADPHTPANTPIPQYIGDWR